MLHKNGYLRLVDLGFAKRVPIGSKTWTFCGTPEYIPPEVISNSGHGISADYWALGILIYELCTRKTPFKAKEDLQIYSNALKGIDSVSFSYKISRKGETIIKALCKLVSIYQRHEAIDARPKAKGRLRPKAKGRLRTSKNARLI